MSDLNSDDAEAGPELVVKKENRNENENEREKLTATCLPLCYGVLCCVV